VNLEANVGKVLVANVAVDGVWYGPDYPNQDVTDEVAERITGASCWEEVEDPKPTRTGRRKG
jgi:hypothetical protein